MRVLRRTRRSGGGAGVLSVLPLLRSASRESGLRNGESLCRVLRVNQDSEGTRITGEARVHYNGDAAGGDRDGEGDCGDGGGDGGTEEEKKEGADGKHGCVEELGVFFWEVEEKVAGEGGDLKKSVGRAVILAWECPCAKGGGANF